MGGARAPWNGVGRSGGVADVAALLPPSCSAWASTARWSARATCASSGQDCSAPGGQLTCAPVVGARTCAAVASAQTHTLRTSPLVAAVGLRGSSSRAPGRGDGSRSPSPASHPAPATTQQTPPAPAFAAARAWPRPLQSSRAESAAGPPQRVYEQPSRPARRPSLLRCSSSSSSRCGRTPCLNGKPEARPRSPPPLLHVN